MATGVQIFNLALIRARQPVITSTTDPPSLADANADQEVITRGNAMWDIKRDELLAMFPWPFAMRRVALDYENGLVTVTGATQADPVVVTAAAHGFENGQGVTFADVGGMTELNGELFTVANAATDTFELWQTDGTSFGAYTSGGTARMKPADDEFEYEHDLPSACLRPFECPGTTSAWVHENGHLLIDDADVNVRYIAQVTSASKFSASFINAFHLFLAIDLAQTITHDLDLVAQIRREFGDVLRQVQQIEAYSDSGEDADDRELSAWQSTGRDVY